MEIRPGRYSYRFEGHSMIDNKKNPWFIVGVGSIAVSKNRIVDGAHHATSHLHGEFKSGFIHAMFHTSGHFIWRAAERRWLANLILVQQSRSTPGPLQTFRGQYTVVPGRDENHYWYISSGAEVERNSITKPASEVTSGELAWTGDL